MRGSAIAETLIALPVLLLLSLGTFQWALIYRARATVEHATLMAARAGAVHHADIKAIRSGFGRALLPLYSPRPSVAGAVSTLATDVAPDVIAFTRIRILNPTREAFRDFGRRTGGQLELPNDYLNKRSTRVGVSSRLSVQDANLLRVQVTYGYRMNVPFVGWVLARALRFSAGFRSGFDPYELFLLASDRIPIVATATVRMQSPARLNRAMVSRRSLPKVPRH